MITNKFGEFCANNVEDDLAELIKAAKIGNKIGIFFEPLSSQRRIRELYLLEDGIPNADAIKEELEGRGYDVRVYKPDPKRPTYIELERL